MTVRIKLDARKNSSDIRKSSAHSVNGCTASSSSYRTHEQPVPVIWRTPEITVVTVVTRVGSDVILRLHIYFKRPVETKYKI